ncbi:MAG: DUF4419 domain-containing protein [Dysgonamonadaceae bacterium]|jgi:hypothetical protein|nr:DUF4419 domain-containing protein [Dysgonamonadaceae bacterium]
MICCFGVCAVFAQKPQGLTFQIEELSKPEGLLPVKSYDDIYKSLILKESQINEYRLKKDSVDFPFDIVAKNAREGGLVNLGYHPFFDGLYSAYAQHRPFVISPDMIWLLISQGFAQHVNANSENLRPHFVNFSGKSQLVVETETELAQLSEKQWEDIFPKFTQQIGQRVGSELINVLASDFSTTTPVEKVASEITIMQAMDSYFEYIVMYVVCGIPEITLQGTTEDWEKVLEKTQRLEKYELAWWTQELEPVLQKIIETSKGKIDKAFWRNIFKKKAEELTRKCGGPPLTIDGWIVKFFPYDKEGNRNNLKELKGDAQGAKLPQEIVKVDLQYIDKQTKKQIPLELWAGFVGLEQDEQNFTLTPKIGWMIRKKDVDEIGLQISFAESDFIELKVSDFPKPLLHKAKIQYLRMAFTDKIIVPDEFSKVAVGQFHLSGKIDDAGIERLKQMFPNSTLIINGEIINGERKPGVINFQK